MPRLDRSIRLYRHQFRGVPLSLPRRDIEWTRGDPRSDRVGPYGLLAYSPTANTVVSKRTSMSGVCFPPVSDATWRVT